MRKKKPKQLDKHIHTRKRQHQPGKSDRLKGVGRVTVHLCNSGCCSNHLIFGFILVQFEFKLGIDCILNDADLALWKHRKPSVTTSRQKVLSASSPLWFATLGWWGMPSPACFGARCQAQVSASAGNGSSEATDKCCWSRPKRPLCP